MTLAEATFCQVQGSSQCNGGSYVHGPAEKALLSVTLWEEQGHFWAGEELGDIMDPAALAQSGSYFHFCKSIHLFPYLNIYHQTGGITLWRHIGNLVAYLKVNPFLNL